MNDQQRSAILEQNLMAAAAHGARVQTRTVTQAVLVRGKPVTHVLHVLLTVFTCGWWGPVWLLLAAFGGEKRSTISVLPTGVVDEVKAPVTAQQIVLMVLAGVWLLSWFLFFGSGVASIFS